MTIVILVIFGIYPLFSQIQNKSSELISQKNRLAELEAKSQNLKGFQLAYKTHQLQLAKINQLFINPEEPLDFIEFLEKEAESGQLEVKISPFSSQQEKQSPWPYLDFQLTLTGAFPEFLKFLERLEFNPYLLEVPNLSVRKEPKSSRISANLLIKVYSQ